MSFEPFNADRTLNMADPSVRAAIQNAAKITEQQMSDSEAQALRSQELLRNSNLSQGARAFAASIQGQLDPKPTKEADLRAARNGLSNLGNTALTEGIRVFAASIRLPE